MSILVIGGAGFVGSHLVDRQVSSRSHVVVVDDLSSGRLSNLQRAFESNRATFVYGDGGGSPDALASLLERAALGRFEVIYHLSAVPRGGTSANAASIDVATTAAIGLALEHGAPLIVAAPAGTHGRGAHFAQAERRATAFAEAAVTLAVRESGLSATFVRYFDAYGPRADGERESVLAPMLHAATRNHALPVPGDGMLPTTMTFVGDVVDGLMRAAKARSSQIERVDLAGTEELSIAAVAQRVAEAADIAFVAETRPAVVDRRARPRPDLVAAEALGWRATVPLDLGLRATYAWFRTERQNYA